MTKLKFNIYMFKDWYQHLYTSDVDVTDWKPSAINFPSIDSQTQRSLNGDLHGEEIKKDLLEMSA